MTAIGCLAARSRASEPVSMTGTRVASDRLACSSIVASHGVQRADSVTSPTFAIRPRLRRACAWGLMESTVCSRLEMASVCAVGLRIDGLKAIHDRSRLSMVRAIIWPFLSSRLRVPSSPLVSRLILCCLQKAVSGKTFTRPSGQ